MYIPPQYLETFVFAVFLVKVAFLITLVSHQLMLRSGAAAHWKKLDSAFVRWHHYAEVAFDLSMGALLMYHFWRGTNTKPISSETTLLLFLFGCLTVIQTIHSEWF